MSFITSLFTCLSVIQCDYRDTFIVSEQTSSTEPDNTYIYQAVQNQLYAYPVGALYLSYSNTSPASLFGGT